MIGKKLRVRSEVAELGYISPWKLTQETSRNNDLELFLSKNAPPDQVASPKFHWARTETRTAQLPRRRVDVSSPKKTTRTETHLPTHADFRHSLQRSYNRKFYSRSASLHATHYCKTELSAMKENEAIFAKRCRKAEKPKLVTLGNCITIEQPKDPNESQAPRAGRRKKDFMLKKQSFTQAMFKDEIANQKGFIVSL